MSIICLVDEYTFVIRCELRLDYMTITNLRTISNLPFVAKITEDEWEQTFISIYRHDFHEIRV